MSVLREISIFAKCTKTNKKTSVCSVSENITYRARIADKVLKSTIASNIILIETDIVQSVLIII